MSKKKDIPTTAKIIQGILMGLCAMVLIGAIGGSLGLHEKGGIATTLYAIVFAAVPVAVGIKSSGWKFNPPGSKQN